MLDIGTSGYTNSRIRCNADIGGYTGYAELRAANSYDMFLNRSTTRTDGGWMYYKFNNDNYMQLSSSGNKVNIYNNTSIIEHLNVGTTGNTSIRIHGTGATTSYAEFKVSNGQNCVWDFQNPSNSNVWSTIKVTGVKLMDFSPTDNIIIHYKPFANWSDDRLKENELSIESACETLSKLRPQLYDKKPDMENDDPTTWYAESGLIAQEIYYDAPELRHSVDRTTNEIDEEGNTIPLPEIPTIDPQQDPDYSSLGKDPASVNYIGLIACLIKTNTELHERVKLLESK